MKRLFMAVLFMLCVYVGASAQYVKVLGIAEQSNTVVVSGVSSSSKFARTFPSATVTILNAGTVTPATIFSASTGSAKANPFTADSFALFDFFIAPGSAFDVRIAPAGGTPASFTRSGYVAPGTTGVSLAVCGGTADTSLLTALSALGGTIEIPKGVTCAANSMTISAALRVDNGGLLKPNTGQTVTLTSAQNKDRWQKFTNATAGLGTVSFSGNVKLDEVYPEWWGCIADGSTACNASFVAAIAAFPNSQPGLNGGILKLGIGTYLVTGLTITNQQIHIIGSGSGGNYSLTNTTSTTLKTASNNFVLKYASNSPGLSFAARLEHLTIDGSSTGGSQVGVWVDNGGIRATDVDVTHMGSHGWLITHSNTGRYINIGAHNCVGDGIRLSSGQSDLGIGTAATQNNTFEGISVTTNGAVGFHFVSGHGNVVFGLDSEQNGAQGLLFDHIGGVTPSSEVTYNMVYGYWSELDVGPGFETAGASQNNYVQLVRVPDVAPVINSTSIGNIYDNAQAYGTAALKRFGPIISAENPSTLTLPSSTGFYLADNFFRFSGSSQKICWSTTLPCIGVSSGTNVLVTNSAGTGAGNLNLGPATSSFIQLSPNGSSGLDIRNGDNSAYGVLTAKNLIAANTGLLRITPKTNDVYGAAMSIDVSIGNHVIAASNTTSATVTMTPNAVGTAGDLLYITTVADASGSVTATFASTFHSSGTQLTTASHFSTITFMSTGSVWVEISRVTNLA